MFHKTISTLNTLKKLKGCSELKTTNLQIIETEKNKYLLKNKYHFQETIISEITGLAFFKLLGLTTPGFMPITTIENTNTIDPNSKNYNALLIDYISGVHINNAMDDMKLKEDFKYKLTKAAVADWIIKNYTRTNKDIILNTNYQLSFIDFADGFRLSTEEFKTRYNYPNQEYLPDVIKEIKNISILKIRSNIYETLGKINLAYRSKQITDIIFSRLTQIDDLINPSTWHN